MHATIARTLQHVLGVAALTALLVTGLPSLDPGASDSLAWGRSASAETAEERAKRLLKRQRIKKRLEPYAPDVRLAIKQEWRRLGKGPGDLTRAIETITGGGNGNSVVKRDAFVQTAYPLLRDYCDSCHVIGGVGRPAIADGNPTVAYDSVVGNQKVRLDDPERSRLVQRLSNDGHHCWSSCGSDAADMQAAIEAWAAIEDSIGDTVDVNAIVSQSSSMDEGVIDKQKGRYEQYVIAKWEFKEGTGDVARDTSRVAPAMDLELRNAEWMSGYGIQFSESGFARATNEASRKLWKHIASAEKGSQQYTIEAWVAPANTDQDGPARIVTYSNGTNERNFTLGQNMYTYVVRNRSRASRSDRNGTPELRTSDADEDAQAYLQHVVVTYDRLRGRRVYVDGLYTGDPEPLKNPDMLLNWNKDYQFVIGNETSRNRRWLGQVRYVAIHNVALTKRQIQRNFDEGIGQRFILRFNLDEWLTTAGHFLEFTVKEFDGYSYLFCEPTFVGPEPLDYRARGLRIAVNGALPVSGQAFVNVDQIVSKSDTVASEQCSVIPKDQGVTLDRFTINFERLASFENVTTEDPPVIVPEPDDTEDRPGIGLRTFDQINMTMSVVTGISPLTGSIPSVYDEIRTQLPSTYDARTFVSAHQVGIAKLALEYCSALVDDPVRRDLFFDTAPGVAWNTGLPDALDDVAERDVLVDAFMNHVVNTSLSIQPTRSEVATAMDSLLDTLSAGCTPATCTGAQTRLAVKAACSAALSSAAMLVY